MTSRLRMSGSAMVALRPADTSVDAPPPQFSEAKSLMTTGLRDWMACHATVLWAMRVLEKTSTTVPSGEVKELRNSRSAS